MLSERQTVVFTFTLLTIMCFTGVNVVATYAPPNEGDIQLVDLKIDGNKYSITKNNIYVEEGDKIVPYVEGKKSAEWVDIKPLSSDPTIKVINNTVYTEDSSCNTSDSDYQSLDNYNLEKSEVERYKIKYSGNQIWLNLYCTGSK
jgi:hypothetical protein